MKGTPMKVLLLSGGADSATLLGLAENIDVHCLTVSYGQRHGREIASAVALAAYYRKPHSVVSVPEVFGKPHALSSDAVPSGPCVVRGRNMAFLSLACAYAANLGASEVLFGSTYDDAADYADCREKFVESFNAMLRSSELDAMVSAPFARKRKAEVIRYGKALGVPYHLTWSCYLGGDKPCGECNACKLRESAFAEASA